MAEQESLMLELKQLNLKQEGDAVFNQLMEVDVDARMKRTSDRPLPEGRLLVGGRSGHPCRIASGGGH